MILVFMYHAVSRAGTSSPMYAYIYLGNAFYIYVGAVIAGASYSILDDRERYRVLKYPYIAPIHIPVYLLGRSVARFLIGTLAVVITLAAEALFFQVPIRLDGVNWPLFLAAMAGGVLCMTFMGIILGTWTMTIRNVPWFIGDATAAALYLFSGAIFPITVLPVLLQPLGFIMPMAYWLELIRRALMGGGVQAFPTFAAFSDAQLFAVLIGITAVFGLLAAFAYRR